MRSRIALEHGLGHRVVRLCQESRHVALVQALELDAEARDPGLERRHLGRRAHVAFGDVAQLRVDRGAHARGQVNGRASEGQVHAHAALVHAGDELVARDVFGRRRARGAPQRHRYAAVLQAVHLQSLELLGILEVPPAQCPVRIHPPGSAHGAHQARARHVFFDGQPAGGCSELERRRQSVVARPHHGAGPILGHRESVARHEDALERQALEHLPVGDERPAVGHHAREQGRHRLTLGPGEAQALGRQPLQADDARRRIGEIDVRAAGWQVDRARRLDVNEDPARDRQRRRQMQGGHCRRQRDTGGG